MPLPKFKTQDEIPDAVRGGYVERNGEWVPEIDDSGLRENARRAIEEKRRAEEALRAITGDRKPEEIADILKRHAALEEEQARKAGDFDKLLEKRIAEANQAWEKKYAEVAPYKQKYEDRELEGIIRKAAIPAGVDAKDLEEYVIPLVKGRRIRLDGDKVVVLDRDGDPTGLTPEKFFAESFKTEAPKFYAATGGSGGGATGGSGGRAPSTGNVANDMNDLVSRIVSDPNAQKAAAAGQFTLRSA